MQIKQFNKILISILFGSVVAFSITETIEYATSGTLTFQIKNIGDRYPVQGATLYFHPSLCHERTIPISIDKPYDYLTCDGNYDLLGPLVSDSNGVVTVELTDRHPRFMRVNVEPPDGYYSTAGSYDLQYLAAGQVIWLIKMDPESLAVPNKQDAVAFLKEQQLIQDIIDFYKIRKIRTRITAVPLGINELETTTWYGLWRVSIELNDEIHEKSRGNLMAYINPVTAEYIICGRMGLRPTHLDLQIYERECDAINILLNGKEQKPQPRNCEDGKLCSRLPTTEPNASEKTHSESLQDYKNYAETIPTPLKQDVELLIGLMEKGKFPIHIPTETRFEELHFSQEAGTIDFNELEPGIEVVCTSRKIEEPQKRVPRDDYLIIGSPQDDKLRCPGKKMHVANLGAGDDELQVFARTHIINPGSGNDEIDLGGINNRNIIIFERGWGEDIVETSCGQNPQYAWLGGWEQNPDWNYRYRRFMVFGKGVFERDLEISEDRLLIRNKVTGDSIRIKSGVNCFNRVFYED